VSSRPKSLHLLATHIADTPTELIPELSTIARWASELLRECSGSRDDGRRFALFSGTQADRELDALLLGLRENPTQLPALAALAFDCSPIVQSGAAEALGLWAT
jgi:hypothetical protein